MTRRFGEMVRAARKSLNLTLDDLQARSRISKPYLSQIETGHAPPPDDTKILQLERELEFPPGSLVRAAHLERTPPDIRVYIEQLRVENESLRQKRLMGHQLTRFQEAGRRDAEQPEPAAHPADAEDDALSAALARLIPLIGRKHTLGPEGIPADVLHLPPEAAEEYIRCPGVKTDGAFAVAIRGDFMADAFREGDLVIFAATPRPRNEADHLVRLDDGVCLFRRVFDDGVAGLRLQPLNPAYPPMQMPRERIHACYRVLATIRTFD